MPVSPSPTAPGPVEEKSALGKAEVGAGKVDSLGRKWRTELHPRDARGRFIETGGVARTFGGRKGRVVRALGKGNVLLAFADGSRESYKANQLVMVARPDGSSPTKKQSKVQAEDARRDLNPARGDGHHVDDHGDRDHDGVPDAQDPTPDGPLPIAGGKPRQPQDGQDPRRFPTVIGVLDHWRAGGDGEGFRDVHHSPEQLQVRAASLESAQLSPRGSFIVGRSGGNWYVYHSGTGSLAAGSAGSRLRTKKDALAIARALDDMHVGGERFDWDSPGVNDRMKTPGFNDALFEARTAAKATLGAETSADAPVNRNTPTVDVTQDSEALRASQQRMVRALTTDELAHEAKRKGPAGALARAEQARRVTEAQQAPTPAPVAPTAPQAAPDTQPAVAQALERMAQAVEHLGEIAASTTRGDQTPDNHPDGPVTAPRAEGAPHEPVRADRAGVLGDVPAQPDGDRGRPGDVLPEARGGSAGADRSGDSASDDPGDVQFGGTDGGVPGGSEGRRGSRDGGPRVPAAGTGDGRPQDAGDAPAGVGGRPDRKVTAKRFNPRGQEDLAPADERAKLEANLAALRTLRKVQAEKRPATPAEQAVLARWGGWGALPKALTETDTTYAKERAELKELLSPAEWRFARDNMLNAHYTDAGLVDEVWQAVRDLGLRGGDVLEPGSGSGNFIGRAPAGVHMTGVELDPVTAGISKLLYPDAEIHNESFGDSPFREDSFDAVVGNVPFGNYPVVDPKYNPKNKHSIHNHFIIKALADLKPGGTAALITSQFTLDGPDVEARKKMYAMADLVGAVRTPSGAHKKAAGTDVVTDVLIFRKRLPGEKPGDDSWLHTAPLFDKDGKPIVGIARKDKTTGESLPGKQADLNDYYRAHPENVLGEFRSGGYNGTAVAGSGDVRPQLHDALARITTDAKAAGRGFNVPADTSGVTRAKRDVGDAREGRVVFSGEVKKDGQKAPLPTFQQWQDGKLVDFPVPDSAAVEVRGLLDMRDAYTALRDLERTTGDDDARLDAARQRLNAVYDSYVKQYGPVTRKGKVTPTAVRAFKQDEGHYDVFGLEYGYDPTPSPGHPYGTAKKADAFSKRQYDRAREVATHTDDPADAMALAAERGKAMDLGTIADLLGVKPTQARKMLAGLAFEDPERGGQLTAKADYLSENVRKKLREARGAAAKDPKYAENVAALEAVKPPDATLGEIPLQLGSTWISPAVLTSFARSLMGGGGNDTTVSLVDGKWSVKRPKAGSYGRSQHLEFSTWGTQDKSFYDLFTALLKQQHHGIKVTRKDSEGNAYVDQKASLDATEKASEIADAFVDWAFQDAKRAQVLTDAYNERFRALAPRSYDGSPRRAFPGMAVGKELRQHQNDAATRMVSEPSVLLEHVVGSGKTFTLVAGAMELKRLGLVNKPVLTVPGHMLGQWSKEIKELYPDAKVLAVDSDSLSGKGNRRRFAAKVAASDWDLVVMTHTSFESIPVTEDAQRAYLNRQLEDMEAQIRRVKGDETKEKALQTKLKKAQAKLEEQIKRRVDDDSIFFEDLGVDYVMADEAHVYKNLDFSSAMQGVSPPAGAGRARDMHMKLEVLREAKKGEANPRVATFATGTPISNTLSEMYTMTRFMRPDLLEDAGIEDFDAWAATFANIASKPEVDTAANGYVDRIRMRGFTDALGDALRIWRTFSDTKTAKHLDLPRPKVKGGHRQITVVQPTDAQVAAKRSFKHRVDNLPGGRPQKGDDTHVAIIGDGRRAALDPRLMSRRGLAAAGINPDEDFESPKVEAAANKIADIWAQNKDRVYKVRPVEKHNGETVDDVPDSPNPGALQMVFIDSDAPKKDQFSAYQELKDQLVARGLDPAKIRFIQEVAGSSEKKAALFEQARQGGVQVVMGSTEALGTGTNVQNRLIAVHHLDGDWKPSAIEQREGRVLRQGNQNDEVELHAYVTQGTHDEKTWDMVSYKQAVLDAIGEGSYDLRAVEFADDVDPLTDFDTLAGSAATDPLVLDRKEAENALKKIRRAEQSHRNQVALAKSNVEGGKRSISGLEENVERLTAAIGRREDTSGDKFTMRVEAPYDYSGDGTPYGSRADAAKALAARLTPMLEDKYGSPGHVGFVGNIAGFDVRAERVENRDRTKRIRLHLSMPEGRGRRTYGFERDDLPVNAVEVSAEGLRTNPGGVVTSLEDRAGSLERRLDTMRASIEQAKVNLGAATADANKPFRRADELVETERRKALLDRLLTGKQTDANGEEVPLTEQERADRLAEYEGLKAAGRAREAAEKQRRLDDLAAASNRSAPPPPPPRVVSPAQDTLTPDEVTNSLERIGAEAPARTDKPPVDAAPEPSPEPDAPEEAPEQSPMTEGDVAADLERIGASAPEPPAPETSEDHPVEDPDAGFTAVDQARIRHAIEDHGFRYRAMDPARYISEGHLKGLVDKHGLTAVAAAVQREIDRNPAALDGSVTDADRATRAAGRRDAEMSLARQAVGAVDAGDTEAALAFVDQAEAANPGGSDFDRVRDTIRARAGTPPPREGESPANADVAAEPLGDAPAPEAIREAPVAPNESPAEPTPAAARPQTTPTPAPRASDGTPSNSVADAALADPDRFRVIPVGFDKPKPAATPPVPAEAAPDVPPIPDDPTDTWQQAMRGLPDADLRVAAEKVRGSARTDERDYNLGRAAWIDNELRRRDAEREASSEAPQVPEVDRLNAAAPDGPETPDEPDAADVTPESLAAEATPPVAGAYTSRVRIEDGPGGTFVYGTAHGDPQEIREALKRDRAFRWDKDGKRWKFWGTPDKRDEAVGHLRGVLADLDRRDSTAAPDVPSDPHAQFPGEDFPPTDEQAAVIDAVLTSDDTVVRALAGTGKTTTLGMLARRTPDKRIVYVAFNKTVQEEGQRRMPRNVESRTADSLSFTAMPKATKDRLRTGIQRPDEVARHLGITTDLDLGDGGPEMTPEEQATRVRRALTSFSISDRDDIGVEDFRNDAEYRALRGYAEKAWADLKSPTGRLHLDNGHVTKMWALSRPDLTKTSSGVRTPAAVVYFDEAQDINPVLAKVVRDQKIQKVYVGDSNQAIYGFRGAVDELNKVDVPHDVPLTKSWRFGPEVADAGNRFLQLLGVKQRVVGGGAPSKVTAQGSMRGADAILVRSNGGMIGEVLREQQAGRVVGVPKGTKADLRSLVDTARWLQGQGRVPSRIHEDLAAFRTWGEVEKAAQTGDDPKITMLHRIVTTNSLDTLNALVDDLVDAGDKADTRTPGVVVSTAHKSKGLEWDRVRIGDDFRGPRVDPETGEADLPEPEELRLAYVAVTRAKKELDPGSLAWVYERTDPNGGDPDAPAMSPQDVASDLDRVGAEVPEHVAAAAPEASATSEEVRPDGNVQGRIEGGARDLTDADHFLLAQGEPDAKPRDPSLPADGQDAMFAMEREKPRDAAGPVKPAPSMEEGLLAPENAPEQPPVPPPAGTADREGNRRPRHPVRRHANDPGAVNNAGGNGLDDANGGVGGAGALLAPLGTGIAAADQTQDVPGGTELPGDAAGAADAGPDIPSVDVPGDATPGDAGAGVEATRPGPGVDVPAESGLGAADAGPLRDGYPAESGGLPGVDHPGGVIPDAAGTPVSAAGGPDVERVDPSELAVGDVIDAKRVDGSRGPVTVEGAQIQGRHVLVTGKDENGARTYAMLPVEHSAKRTASAASGAEPAWNRDVPAGAPGDAPGLMLPTELRAGDTFLGSPAKGSGRFANGKVPLTVVGPLAPSGFMLQATVRDGQGREHRVNLAKNRPVQVTGRAATTEATPMVAGAADGGSTAGLVAGHSVSELDALSWDGLAALLGEHDDSHSLDALLGYMDAREEREKATSASGAPPSRSPLPAASAPDTPAAAEVPTPSDLPEPLGVGAGGDVPAPSELFQRLTSTSTRAKTPAELGAEVEALNRSTLERLIADHSAQGGSGAVDDVDTFLGLLGPKAARNVLRGRGIPAATVARAMRSPAPGVRGLSEEDTVGLFGLQPREVEIAARHREWLSIPGMMPLERWASDYKASRDPRYLADDAAPETDVPALEATADLAPGDAATADARATAFAGSGDWADLPVEHVRAGDLTKGPDGSLMEVLDSRRTERDGQPGTVLTGRDGGDAVDRFHRDGAAVPVHARVGEALDASDPAHTAPGRDRVDSQGRVVPAGVPDAVQPAEPGGVTPEQLDDLDGATVEVTTRDGRTVAGRLTRAYDGNGHVVTNGNTRTAIDSGGVDGVRVLSGHADARLPAVDAGSLRPGAMVVSGTGTDRVAGTVRDVTPDGAVKVQTPGGDTRTIPAGRPVHPVGRYSSPAAAGDDGRAPGVWAETGGDGVIAASAPGQWSAVIVPTEGGKVAWRVSGQGVHASVGHAATWEDAKGQVAERLREAAAAGRITTLPRTSAAHPNDDSPVTAPAPINGSGAEWVSSGDLQVGDQARVTGYTDGEVGTYAGHVVGQTPVLVDRAGRLEPMVAVTVAENPDGQEGWRGTVLASLDSVSARVPSSGDGLASMAEADVARGALPDRLPADPDGRALFPGTLVEDKPGGRTGIVTQVRRSDVSVSWSDGKDTDHVGAELVVADGGLARPAGWTEDGARVTPGTVVDYGVRKTRNYAGAETTTAKGQGTVESVDGDDLLVSTHDGVKPVNARTVRVVGQSAPQRPDQDDAAPAEPTDVTHTQVDHLEAGDVVLLTGQDGSPFAAKVDEVEPDGTYSRLIHYTDTRDGSPGLVQADRGEALPTAVAADGTPASLERVGGDTTGDARVITQTVIEPVDGPTVQPALLTAHRNLVNGLGLDVDAVTDPVVAQAAARVRAGEPLTGEQAAKLAAAVRASVSSEASGVKARGLARAADYLDATAGLLAGNAGGRPKTFDVAPATLGTARDVAVGDMAALPSPDGPWLVGRVVDVKRAAGGLAWQVTVDSQGERSRRLVAADAPVWRLPDVPDPVDADPAAPRLLEDPPAPVGPSEAATLHAADAADGVAADAADAAMAASTVNEARDAAAQALDAVNTDRLPAAPDAESKAAADAAVAATRDAALKTINEVEGLPGESERDTAGRLAGMLLDAPRAAHADEEARRKARALADKATIAELARGRRGDATGEQAVIDDAQAGRVDATVNEVAAAVRAAGVGRGTRLTPAMRRDLTGRADRAVAARHQGAARTLAAGRGQEPGLMARIGAAFAELRRKIVAAWREALARNATLQDAVKGFREGLRDASGWAETHRLRRLAGAGDGVAVLAAGEPADIPGRVAFWTDRLPEAGKFGAKDVTGSWFDDVHDAQQARTGVAVTSGTRTVRDTAADGGPGEHALTHLDAVRGLGRAVGDDVTARVAATVPDLGPDPHAAVRDARVMADDAERQWRDLAAAHDGAAADAEARAYQARRAADDVSTRYAAALADAVKAVLGGTRPLGPGDGVALQVKGRAGSPEVDAVRWAEQFLPRDWIAAAGPLEVYTGPRAWYDPNTGRMSIHDRASALHELMHHVERHVPDVAAAEWAYYWARTSTGDVGARQRTGRNDSRPLRDLFPNSGHAPDEVTREDGWADAYVGREYSNAGMFEVAAMGMESLFGGEWYLDDDMRDWLLGTLAGVGRTGGGAA